MTLQDLFYQVKEQNTEGFSELLFNLYEDTSAYTVEAVFDDDALLIGRDDPAFICENHGDFHAVLREFEKALRTFYEQHKNVFENLKVISYGFVDGDLEYMKGTDNSYSEEEQQPTGKTAVKEKLQRLIEQKISQWQEQDIYAISLYVYDEEDDPRRPVAVLGYNTERRVQESIPQASDEQEARWNYAFWLQNEELCLGRGDTAEDVRSWIKGLDLWDREEEITEAFVGMLVRIVKDIHASGILQERFGKEIPILVHELEYHEQIKNQNIEANGVDLVRDFALFCMQDGTPDANDKMPALESKTPGPERKVLGSESKSSELKSSPLSRNHGVQAQKRSTAVPRRKSWEPAKKVTDMRTVIMFLVTLVFTVGLIACLYFLYLYNRDTAADKQGHRGTQQGNQELPEPTIAVPDAASDSYQLRYDGMDTGVEILLKDWTYTDDGKACELIHFIAEEDGRISYYIEGNEDAKISLQSDEEYEKLLSYWEEEPGWPKWFDCNMFAYIPQ